MKLPDIYIIGSGNIASHLAEQFTKQNLPLKGLFARNQKEGKQICRKNKIQFLKSLPLAEGDQSVIFCCISDDAISTCIDNLRQMDALIVHCSGIKQIPERKQGDLCRFGVFYPVISFSKNIPVNWTDVPVCIEASDQISFRVLKNISKKIKGRPYSIQSEERAIIHLSAVFVNNFTNMMYITAEKILFDHQLSFELLKPLVSQTAEKAMKSKPNLVQTGPARRGDKKTIRAHRRLLAGNPDILKVYNNLTALIYAKYHP
jgi:predicted short-subunit dehydrogenase-like oxidoreductase (DUF2520 family)